MLSFRRVGVRLFMRDGLVFLVEINASLEPVGYLAECSDDIGAIVVDWDMHTYPVEAAQLEPFAYREAIAVGVG